MLGFATMLNIIFSMSIFSVEDIQPKLHQIQRLFLLIIEDIVEFYRKEYEVVCKLQKSSPRR